MKTIDIKSLLIGILATAFFVCACGAINAYMKFGSQVGRYVHHPRSPITILDTVSGDLYVTTADVLSLESTQPVWYKILTIKSKDLRADQHDDEGK